MANTKKATLTPSQRLGLGSSEGLKQAWKSNTVGCFYRIVTVTP